MELTPHNEERYRELKLKEFHLSLSRAERRERNTLYAKFAKVENIAPPLDLELLQQENVDLQARLAQTQLLQSLAIRALTQLHNTNQQLNHKIAEQ